MIYFEMARRYKNNNGIKSVLCRRTDISRWALGKYSYISGRKYFRNTENAIQVNINNIFDSDTILVYDEAIFNEIKEKTIFNNKYGVRHMNSLRRNRYNNIFSKKRY